jgi:tetratricopeptide (TPR) repeat protein
MLLHEGRFPEANDQLDLAQRLEPTSASILSTRALALGLSGHRNEASDMLQELLTEVPTATSPHASLATLSLIVPRDPPRYLEEFRRVGELRHDEELLQMISAGAGAYHQAGENAMWLAMLNQQESQHPANRTYYMMEAEAALGRKDAAFADLRQLIQNRDSRVIGIVIDPTLAPLRSDPRFAEVLKSIGLPPLSTH